jgi:hypothetical protein
MELTRQQKMATIDAAVEAWYAENPNAEDGFLTPEQNRSLGLAIAEAAPWIIDPEIRAEREAMTPEELEAHHKRFQPRTG